MFNKNHHRPRIRHRLSTPSETAAFFDVDGTLIPGTYAERIFIRYLMSKRALTWKNLARYSLSVIAGGKLLRRQAWEQNKTYLRGQRARAIQELAQGCFRDRIRSRLSPRALAVVEDHLLRGHRVYLISASLSYLVDPLQRHLGAHGALATQLTEENGRLTGQIKGGFLYGQRKAKLLSQWISRWNIDPGLSFAYSDHHSDIPLLEMVGHPVAVNPDGKLRHHARRRGWPVEIF